MISTNGKRKPIWYEQVVKILMLIYLLYNGVDSEPDNARNKHYSLLRIKGGYANHINILQWVVKLSQHV